MPLKVATGYFREVEVAAVGVVADDAAVGWRQPTDCSLPAGNPSCWIWLTWTLPLASANCVTPPVPKLITGLPSDTPLTTQLVSVTEGIAGDIWPEAEKVKFSRKIDITV